MRIRTVMYWEGNIWVSPTVWNNPHTSREQHCAGWRLATRAEEDKLQADDCLPNWPGEYQLIRDCDVEIEY